MTKTQITFTDAECGEAYRRRKLKREYDSYYYGKRIFQEPERVIQRYVEYMAHDTEANDHDTLIGTGISGALAAALLAVATGRMYAVLRKDGVNSHSSRKLEGQVGERWVFVDDFISGGGTRQRVRDFILSHLGDETTYVGDWLYDTETQGPWIPAPKQELKLREVPSHDEYAPRYGYKIEPVIPKLTPLVMQTEGTVDLPTITRSDQEAYQRQMNTYVALMSEAKQGRGAVLSPGKYKYDITKDDQFIKTFGIRPKEDVLEEIQATIKKMSTADICGKLSVPDKKDDENL